MTVFLMTGNAETRLQELDDESVNLCVTSPPYYGLRNYSEDAQIGHEDTPDAYIEKLVAVFREVRRVLRGDGSLWVVIGDCYAATGKSGGGTQGAAWDDHGAQVIGPKGGKWSPAPIGLKQKDLIGIPWMLAFALRRDGWYLREEIIWRKESCMPESVKDRATRQHETVFHLTKSQTYYHDWFAIAEPAAGMSDHDLTGPGYAPPGQSPRRGSRPHGSGNGYKRESRLTYTDDNGARGNDTPYEPCSTRNARSVWTINPEQFDSQMCTACGTYFRGADYKRLPKDSNNHRACSTCGSNTSWLSHFAVFPTRLASRIIQCSTPEGGCCPSCGTPLTRILEKGKPDDTWRRNSGGDAQGGYDGASRDGATDSGAQDASATKARILAGMVTLRSVGWKRACGCPGNGTAARSVVLDPFSGASTTALSATRLGRDCVCIDLKREYHDMAAHRLRDEKARTLDGASDRLPFVGTRIDIA